ncbi:MAG: hypothetical protein GX992_02165 [Clostridium sp.]|nr:hypothetical protein [Clostridium sp.]
MKRISLYKKSGMLTLVVVLGIIAVYIVQIVNASPAEQSDLDGNEEDGEIILVSLDYIKGIEEKLEKTESEFAQTEKRLEQIESYGKFIPLELEEGQLLMTGDSAEIILRGGKALAIGGEGGGLSDITSGSGADVNTDEEVPLNHLLLVSRDDGRGIKITSKKAWVLVKGPYSIE